MRFNNLEEKINHARDLEVKPGTLNTDFHKLLERGKFSDKTFLSYWDAGQNKVEITYADFHKHVSGTVRFLDRKVLKKGKKLPRSRIITGIRWFSILQPGIMDWLSFP